MRAQHQNKKKIKKVKDVKVEKQRKAEELWCDNVKQLDNI